SQIYCVEMGDYTHLKEGTKPVLLLSPNQEWELVTGDYRWNEGPHVLKKDGTYYLFYSGGCYADKTYSMGYATSASPMGPFEKYEHNPIIASTDDVSGPGNNSFFVTRDGKELYNCYHTHTIKIIGGGNRKVTFDRCGYRADGTFYMNGPTTTYQAPISGLGDLDKVDNYSEYAYIIKNDGKYISKSALDLASDMGKPEAGEYLMERLLSLTDGETLNSKNEEMYEWSVYSDTNDSSSDLNGEMIPAAAGFKIGFDATETINCIYLYGTNRQNFVPEQIEIFFDNNKKLGTDDLCIKVPAGQAEPVVLSFESVNTASVTVAVKDFGNADGFALSDVAFYRKK
ncbi:MAG: family 43 glycosylhydrolase, partial [Lachnospiraceae bacterium]|nr:family 43 glycosylhydrolase [Lachnospiraceae bacterium]